MRTRPHKQLLGYVVAVVVIAAATAVLKVFGSHVNHTTVALTLLLVVLFVATAWGSKPAVLAALLGVAPQTAVQLDSTEISAGRSWVTSLWREIIRNSVRTKEHYPLRAEFTFRTSPVILKGKFFEGNKNETCPNPVHHYIADYDVLLSVRLRSNKTEPNG